MTGAWYVKDFADGWIKFYDEQMALNEAKETGAIMQWSLTDLSKSSIPSEQISVFHATNGYPLKVEADRVMDKYESLKHKHFKLTPLEHEIKILIDTIRYFENYVVQLGGIKNVQDTGKTS